MRLFDAILSYITSSLADHEIKLSRFRSLAVIIRVTLYHYLAKPPVRVVLLFGLTPRVFGVIPLYLLARLRALIISGISHASFQYSVYIGVWKK